MAMRRVSIDVVTDSSGDFVLDIPGWGGWYLYAVRFIDPPIASDALDSSATVMSISDVDLDESAWDRTGYVSGTYHPIFQVHRSDGQQLSFSRVFEFFDTIRITISNGGNTKKCMIHLFLTEEVSR